MLGKLKQYLLRPFRKIHQSIGKMNFQVKKNLIDQNLLFCKESGVSSEKYCDHEIIVSLTTYGRRLHSVYMTIESIMEQTMKANRIVLWLDKSFEGKRLPESINMLCKRGLEVSFCKDIRSYKKLIPTLCKYPNDAIITVDDDVIYNINMLENLIVPYIVNPKAIYCNRAHRILVDKIGNVLPYNKWEFETQKIGCGNLFFPTGVGGVLYPPHSLDEEVKNEDVFFDICKTADDVWFKAMALKKGTPVCRVETHNIKGCEYMVDDEVQDMGLFNQNVGGESLNDKQIASVFSKYDLYKLLKEENVH